jgi:tRNA (guanine-N7-)-methyltransferase
MRRVLDELGPRHGVDALARRSPARALVLEVGCGDGEAALAFARTHPDADILAVDVHVPGVVRLLEAAEDEAVGNLFVERADALELLDEQLAASSLHGLHLFFPDPWPKARHHKRRLVRPDVLDLLADRLVPDAEMLVATDVADYVEWALAHLDGHGAFVGGIADRPSWRPTTRYEATALSEGRAIVDLRYRRR